MAIRTAGNTSVARVGGYYTIVTVFDGATAVEVSALLARANREGVEGASPEVRQLLTELQEALNGSLYPSRSPDRS